MAGTESTTIPEESSGVLSKLKNPGSLISGTLGDFESKISIGHAAIGSTFMANKEKAFSIGSDKFNKLKSVFGSSDAPAAARAADAPAAAPAAGGRRRSRRKNKRSKKSKKRKTSRRGRKSKKRVRFSKRK